MNNERYKELFYFCLQYKSKEKISERKTIEGAKALIDIKLIQEAAELANQDLKPYILESVTSGKSWEQLTPPCGRRQFYKARHEFFEILSRLKN